MIESEPWGSAVRRWRSMLNRQRASNSYRRLTVPKQYEAIRDKLAKKMPEKDAKTKAAKIYNAKRKPGQKPVTRKAD